MRHRSSRRRFLAVTGAIALAGCTGVSDNDETVDLPDEKTTDLDPIGTEWPMKYGDAQRTGHVGVDSGSRPDELAWEWSGSSVMTRPVMADNRLFFSPRGFQGMALDAQTGEALWSKVDIAGLGAADSELVYGRKNGIVAYDAKTGEVEWKQDAEYSGTATLYDGSLYYGSKGFWKHSADDGELMWSVEESGTTDPIAVNDRGVFGIVFVDRIVHIDHEGEFVWEQSTDGRFGDYLTLVDDLVLVDMDAKRSGPTDTNLHAFDADSGERRWEYEIDDSYIITNPVINDDRIFVMDRDGVVHAITLEGDRLWTVDADPNSEGWYGSAIPYGITATDSWLYVMGFDDSVHVLDPDSDSGLTEAKWDYVPFFPPFVVDDVAFIVNGSDSASVTAVTLT
ncbi:PQQ-binding-like beta-propeller repeat protein [Natribaculum luteum]|uniref:outer membrane protein assembly factor BamB family protein n=1 Tax=Natribaculum luteum TaxID=1586232 RepID=UPI001FF6BDB9|nr:PQQ-binding-like beta-propeller repeat protein [Natribaculum luteum]